MGEVDMNKSREWRKPWSFLQNGELVSDVGVLVMHRRSWFWKVIAVIASLLAIITVLVNLLHVIYLHLTTIPWPEGYFLPFANWKQNSEPNIYSLHSLARVL